MSRYNIRRSVTVAIGLLACGLIATPWVLADHHAGHSADHKGHKGKAMQVFYLEIISKEVDTLCATYSAATGAKFGEPIPGFGNARTAALPDGGMVGIRAPMRPDEDPIVRPYWLVDDIKASLAKAEKAGGKVAHPPMEIPGGYGTFAIYIQGGIEHGLWQK